MLDSEAFAKVRERLENDVGQIIQLTRETRKQKDWCPWWALLRMLLPVAESIGDLLYRDKRTTHNLFKFFKNDLSQYNPRYGKFAALLALLYRHPMVHQDELPLIRYDDKEVGWAVSFEEQAHHLEVAEAIGTQLKRRWIRFDTTQFYDDLVRACRDKAALNHGGSVGMRYQEWLTRRIPTVGTNSLEKEAGVEVGELFEEVVDSRISFQNKGPEN